MGIIKKFQAFNLLRVVEPAEPVRGRPVDPEQDVAVGTGATAAGPGLDAEEIVEQLGDEFGAENPAVVPDVERHDGSQSLGIIMADKSYFIDLT
jgi:hypothetical protein